MAYLFSYGTLQQPEIQKALFNRKLEGWDDVLFGFELSQTKAYGEYPIIARAKDEYANVTGKVYKVSDKELEQVDAYEGDQYTRISVKLQSGKEAWAYVTK